MRRLRGTALSLGAWGLTAFALLRHFDLRQRVESIRQARSGLVILGSRVDGVPLCTPESALTDLGTEPEVLGLAAADPDRLHGQLGPARRGEVVCAHFAASRHYDPGRSTALASIAVERILDGLLLSVLEASSPSA